MASSCFFLSITSLVAILAAVSCQTCTRSKIKACATDNTDQFGCINYKAATDCIKGMEDDCDNANGEIATEDIKYFDDKKDACTGFGSELCYEHFVEEPAYCMRAGSKSDKFITISDAPTDEQCKTLKAHLGSAKGCFNYVKSSCTGKKELDVVEGKLSSLDKMAKKCEQ